jgi:hypothetical protein
MRLAAVALAGIVSISCGSSEHAVAALEPLDVVTGWFDAGIVEGGKNKLVPSVTLKLRNKSDEPIRSVQVNAIFRRVGEQEMWGEYFGWAIPREPLPAGATTNTLVMRSALGYTGTRSSSMRRSKSTSSKDRACGRSSPSIRFKGNSSHSRCEGCVSCLRVGAWCRWYQWCVLWCWQGAASENLKHHASGQFRIRQSHSSIRSSGPKTSSSGMSMAAGPAARAVSGGARPARVARRTYSPP